MSSHSESDSPSTMSSTWFEMSEKVATEILSGVVKLSGFFTSPIMNSKAGNKFFSLLPGEIVLASLDGFGKVFDAVDFFFPFNGKVFDAVEVAGRNVMSTSVAYTYVMKYRLRSLAYSPVQAAVGIAACGLSPEIPKDYPYVLRSLMTKCWDNGSSKRPQSSEILVVLLRPSNNR